MKHGGEMLQGVPGHHSQHSARFGRLHGQEHGGEECGVAFLHERGEAHASLSEWSIEHEAGEGSLNERSSFFERVSLTLSSRKLAAVSERSGGSARTS